MILSPSIGWLTSAPTLLGLLLFSPCASAGTLFVDAGLTTGLDNGSSWANAYQGTHGLKAALAVAVASDQVFVASGTYLPSSTGSRSDSFNLINAVEIYGGFVGTESSPAERPPFGTASSVLSGDLGGNDGSGTLTDNSYHVVRGAGTNASAVFDGFTVSGGNANGAGNDNRGGGMIFGGGSASTMRNSLFTGNRCTFGGGAGYINNASPSFTDCSFVNNIGGSFGGAFDIATAGAVIFDRCLFQGNRASRAGALEIFSTTGVKVINSVFLDNTATGGSGGGAIWMGSGGNTQVRNCTVVGNSATSQAVGGLRVSGGNPTIANCIFWANTGSGGAMGSANQVAGTANVTYSIVTGGFAGTGNLGADPSFQDLGAGNFALTLASPAIDAGDNSMVPAGITLDHVRNPRFVDEPGVVDTGAGSAPITDIGAFEFQASATTGFCFGDGSGTACPCNNNGAAGNGCGNGSFPAGCHLSSTGAASVSNDTLTLVATASAPGKAGMFFLGTGAIAGGNGATFGDGLRCAGGSICRLQLVVADGAGVANSTISIAAKCGPTVGQVHRMQWWFRDTQGSPCGSGFNLSNGVEATWAP